MSDPILCPGGNVATENVQLKGQLHEILEFFIYINIGRASFRDPPLIFLKFVFRVVIELFNLKDPMR
jgi:hypothetical protein